MEDIYELLAGIEYLRSLTKQGIRVFIVSFLLIGAGYIPGIISVLLIMWHSQYETPPLTASLLGTISSILNLVSPLAFVSIVGGVNHHVPVFMQSLGLPYKRLIDCLTKSVIAKFAGSFILAFLLCLHSIRLFNMLPEVLIAQVGPLSALLLSISVFVPLLFFIQAMAAFACYPPAFQWSKMGDFLGDERYKVASRLQKWGALLGLIAYVAWYLITFSRWPPSSVKELSKIIGISIITFYSLMMAAFTLLTIGWIKALWTLNKNFSELEKALLEEVRKRNLTALFEEATKEE